MQPSPYFFYGSPAKYALVGQEDQHIWLVMNDLKLAKFISLVFESKITTVIFDLTTFKNYTPDLIDNSVCFNWQVPVNVLRNIGVLDTDSNKINSIVYTGTGLELKNIVEHDIFLLPKDRCLVLQNQMMCLHNIGQQINLNNLIISNKLKEIFSFNLELKDIESELYKLANELIVTDFDDSVEILKIFNRLYE